MKSDINPDQYYIECQCQSPRHLLNFQFEDKEWMRDLGLKEFDGREIPKELYICITAPAWVKIPLKVKIKNIWDYLFKKQDLLLSETILVDESSIATFEEILKRMKNKGLLTQLVE